ncbi:D-alanine--D-alanine ligase family protein [Psychromicrobium lacuslunae]|uniref:D-alanine--D-alanine ligase n=1 Tax=Psychromicrobium lacuslunae TaxID=1618207 RepID=A0A0D4C0I6_9MICC|nr:ATP-grasp domain-containing protein [Psychromicrobium lacuslunae]AJT42088.1 hypothetical protein UM93_12280 [Psychromicrobium lacuslunae]
MRHASLKVAVIGGGANTEYQVGLASAAAVSDSLIELGHEVIGLTIDQQGRWASAQGELLKGGLSYAIALMNGCDLVFPVVHGELGEDGTLAALLELLGKPYIGAPTAAGAIAMDKIATKAICRGLGIAVAEGELIGPAGLSRTYALPAVAKPVTGGSSHGVQLIRSRGELSRLLRRAREGRRRLMIEEYVSGREIDIAVLRKSDGSLLVGPALEITVQAGGIFGAVQKYDGSAVFMIPAALTSAQQRHLESTAGELYETLGCAGVARIDFFLREDQFVLNEINTMPGLTKQSQVPRMFAQCGLSHQELVAELLAAPTIPLLASPVA